MSATDHHSSSLTRSSQPLIGLSTIDIPETSHSSNSHHHHHHHSLHQPYTTTDGGPFHNNGAPLAADSTGAALSIGGTVSSPHSSSTTGHHNSSNLLYSHHPHHQRSSAESTYPYSNHQYSTYGGSSIGQWSPVKHMTSMSPYPTTVSLDYSIALKSDRDSPAVSGSSSNNSSSNSSSTSTVSSLTNNNHHNHNHSVSSLYSGMPHSAPTLIGVSDDYATSVPRTGSAMFGGSANDTRVFGHALDFSSHGTSSSSDDSPTEVKISAPTPLSSFPQLPRFAIHSIPPFKPPSSSFKTESSPSNVDVKIPIIDPSSVSVSTQASSTSVSSGNSFLSSLPYTTSIDRYPLTKRRKYESSDHSHLTGLSSTGIPIQYQYTSAPVASLQPLMAAPAVTLAGRPSYSATISFPSFGGGGALVPPGLAGHSSSSIYGSNSTPAGMMGDISMPPDVIDHYTDSVRSSPRKRKPRRKSGASARSMDRDELVFVRFLFEDTEGLRNTDDLSAGDATAGPNAKGFQRGGRRTTKANAVTVTHFGTKPPAEHPAYSRIRVWKDERGRQFYDCVCNARKPVQDLNKIKKHALSHDQGRFMCDICGKVFGKNHLQLNAHKKTHKAKRNRAAMDSTSMPNTAASSAMIHAIPPAPVLPPPALPPPTALSTGSSSVHTQPGLLSHLTAGLVAPPPPPMMP